MYCYINVKVVFESDINTLFYFVITDFVKRLSLSRCTLLSLKNAMGSSYISAFRRAIRLILTKQLLKTAC